MLNTAWAVVRDGKIELLEQADLPEGVRALVTLLPDEDTQFWLGASQSSMDAIWDNTEDDVYAQSPWCSDTGTARAWHKPCSEV